MKKLLILALVVGLASVSYGYLVPVASTFSAVLSGTTLTIKSSVGLASGLANAENVGLYDLSGTHTFTSPAILPSSATATAGSLRAINVFNNTTDGYGMDIWAGSTGSESPVWDAAAGDWYTVTYSGHVGDALDVENVQNAYHSEGTIYVTPEPMTIALLGLGGLLLRRRIA